MNTDIATNGNLVISLDFEINWGVWDVVKFDQYKNNLLGVRKVIPTLLQLFDKYSIRATFGTVGLLFFQNRQELEEGLPGKRPAYEDPAISPYENHIKEIGVNEEDDPFHFAPSLIKLIEESGQEVGCHTFCHYYCLESGQTVEAFAADLRAAKNVAARNGIILKSLIFPRNQFNSEYLQVCKDEGFSCYRGNEKSWVYKPHQHSSETYMWRIIRTVDAYINLTGHHCYMLKGQGGLPFNIPSSRFLRPYSKKLAFFDRIKLKRITDGMSYAAKNGLTYHLWWHPHNFGVNLEKNISFLEKILIHYKKLSVKYNFQSRNMQQVAELLSSSNEQ
ncbi:MAG: polysaccharide deacetylase family protein [Ginsengibacter sp.]